jgi:hypothetical protein
LLIVAIRNFSSINSFPVTVNFCGLTGRLTCGFTPA